MGLSDIDTCLVDGCSYCIQRPRGDESSVARLSTFMSLDFVDVLRSTSKTAEIYGELAFVCRKRGRVLSNNDLWIASLAIEYDVPLVTYDKDFSALSSRLGDNLILLDTN